MPSVETSVMLCGARHTGGLLRWHPDKMLLRYPLMMRSHFHVGSAAWQDTARPEQLDFCVGSGTYHLGDVLCRSASCSMQCYKDAALQRIQQIIEGINTEWAQHVQQMSCPMTKTLH